MTGTTRSSEGLEARRKKALYRSWHRGMREVDLLLGGFADAQISHLTEAEIDQYEALLDIPDNDILSWITGERPAPAERDTALFRKIQAFGR
jgi:antitoxin CptB